MGSYERLNKLIEKGKSEATGRIPINIESFFSPENEIVKNIIASNNKSLSKEDIDIMVDGFPETGIFSKVPNIQSLTSNLPNLPNIPNTPNLPNTEGIVDQLSNLPTPNATSIDLSQATNLTPLPTLNLPKPESLKDVEKIVSSGDTLYKRQVISNNLKDEIKEGIVYPIEKKRSALYKLAKQLKEKLIKFLDNLFQKAKTLFQDAKLAAIKLVQSIPAAIGFLFTFNLPAVLNTIANTIIILNQLRRACMDIKATISEFEIINLVLKPEGKEKVSEIILAVHKTLDTILCSFLEKINEFITKALAFISGNVTEKRKAKNARIATKRLRKFKYLPNNNYTKVDEDDKDEVEDILSEWVVINKDDKKAAVKKKNDEGINDALKELNNLKDVNDEFNKLITDAQNVPTPIVLYDIEFEDGTKLFGLTAEDIEKYNAKYKIVYL